MTSIVPLFTLLSSHDEVTRIDSSSSLLATLAAPATKHDDVDYALDRLVHGLASSSNSSRLGFATALAALLAQSPEPTVKPAVAAFLEASDGVEAASPLKKGKQVNGKGKQPSLGQATDAREERSLLLGQLLLAHALFSSGALDPTASHWDSKADEGTQAFDSVLAGLLRLANKKTWLRESVSWVVVEHVKALLAALPEDGSSKTSWREARIKAIAKRVIDDPRERARGLTAESIALALLVRSADIEGLEWKALLAPTFPQGDPLHTNSLPALAQILKTGSTAALEEGGSKGPAPQGSNAVKTSKQNNALKPGGAPHFVWEIILDAYTPVDGKKPKKIKGRADWEKVWKVLVEDTLLTSHTLPPKALGLHLILLSLPRIPHPESLFHPTSLRVLSNSLRRSATEGASDPALKKLAEKVVAAIPASLAGSSTKLAKTLQALTEQGKEVQWFDSKVWERLVGKLDEAGAQEWFSFLKKVVVTPHVDDDDDAAIAGVETPDEEEQQVEGKQVGIKRTWAMDAILTLLRAKSVPKSATTQREAIALFAKLGWFSAPQGTPGNPSPALTEAQVGAARSRLFSVLSGSSALLKEALEVFKELEKDDDLAKISSGEDEEDETVEVACKALRTKLKALGSSGLSKKDKKKQKEATTAVVAAVEEEDPRKEAAKTLLRGALLLARDEEIADRAELLEKVDDAVAVLFPKVFEAPKASTKAADAEPDSDDEDDEEAEDLEPSTVLTDTLLDLLRVPSAFVKSFVLPVFSGFVAELGEQGVDLVLEQIRTERSLGIEEEKADGEKMDEDAGSDAEGSGSDSDDSSDDESDGDEDAEGDGMEVDEAFRNELLAALQASGVADLGESDSEEDDDKEASADEELLNDEQMLALDDRLADIFRTQRTSGRKGKQLAEKDDLHYRLRVLDLLEVFVKAKTTQPGLAIFLPVPLFALAIESSALEAEVASKGAKLLRLVVNSKVEPSAGSSDIHPDQAIQQLRHLLDIAASTTIGEHVQLCSQASAFLARSAVALEESANASAINRSAAEAFGAAFGKYLLKKNSKSKVLPTLLQEYAKRVPASAVFCLPGLLAHLDNKTDGKKPVNAYRTVQVFEVAQAIFNAFQSAKSVEAKSVVLESRPAFKKALVSILESPLSSESATALDAGRLREVCKVALAAFRVTTPAGPDFESYRSFAWSSPAYATLLEKYKENEKFKNSGGLHKLIQQLISVSTKQAGTSPAAAGTKRKADAVQVNGNGKAKKQKGPAAPPAAPKPAAPAVSEADKPKKKKKKSKSAAE